VRITRHLSYANVISTVALLIALAGGTAYAVDKINSRDVVNASLKSIDLKNHRGVRDVDVKRNTLTGRQINERTLKPGGIVSVNGDETVNCTPSSVTVFTSCATTALRLHRPSRVLVIATGNQESVGGPGQASCRMSVDGVPESLSVHPGEQTTRTTSPTATNGFARTLVSSRLTAGVHRFDLGCKRFGGGVRIDSPTIAAVAIGTR
jgi:hypothetical protein